MKTQFYLIKLYFRDTNDHFKFIAFIQISKFRTKIVSQVQKARQPQRRKIILIFRLNNLLVKKCFQVQELFQKYYKKLEYSFNKRSMSKNSVFVISFSNIVPKYYTVQFHSFPDAFFLHFQSNDYSQS